MKYIAKQIPFDMQESYFDYTGELYAIYGNREFKEYKSELFDHVLQVLEDGHLLDDMDKLSEEYTISNNDSEYRKVIEEYFPITENRKTAYTQEEIYKIRIICEQYNYSGLYNDIDFICELLSIMTEKNYTHKEIHGSVQRDWNIIIYPEEDYTDETIRWIETEYFNTGIEFIVYPEEDPENCVSVYVHDYDDDSIKKEIADSVCCNVEEIEIHHFIGYSQIANYD